MLQTGLQSDHPKEDHCWVADDFVWFGINSCMISIRFSDETFKSFIRFLGDNVDNKEYCDVKIDDVLFALEGADQEERNLVVCDKTVSIVYNFPHANIAKLRLFLVRGWIENWSDEYLDEFLNQHEHHRST